MNPLKEHRERITKGDREIALNLNYDRTEFPVEEKDFEKIEIKNNICINVFFYENKMVFPVYVCDKKFENSMDLSLLINDDKSHYFFRNIFNTKTIKINNSIFVTK